MFEKILARLGSTLDESNLPYMIIGGQAVLLYGEPRLTRDIDITLGVGIDHLDALLQMIKKIPLKALPEDAVAFVKQTMVLPAVDESTGIRVDFIFSFTSYESQAINRANHIKILGQDVSFARVEDLIIHKIFAGRPRDMEDVRIILLKNQESDTRYIETWLMEFDAAADEKIFLSSFRALLK
jgi:predicted nucleotidyltransferase